MRTLPIVLALTLAPLPCAARVQAPDSAPPFDRTLVGHVGERDAQLVLSHAEGRLDGLLAFTSRVPSIRSRRTDLRLTGSLDADGHVDLSVGPPERPDPACPSPSGVLRGALTRVPRTRDDPIALSGTWRTNDGRELPFDLAERRPAAIGGNRIVSRTVAGDSQDKQFRGLVSPTDLNNRPAPSYQLEITYPELVDRNGRPARWFGRAVDTILFTLLGGFVDECYRAESSSPEDEDMRISIDYEVAYASPDVVSILFRRKGRCVAASDAGHDDESGLNVDLRTHRFVRLAAQFRSPQVARGLFTDFDRALTAATIFDDRTGVPDSLPGDFGGWYFDERGIAFMHFSAITTTGTIAYLVVPWAFVRRALRPSSPLHRVAFPPTKRVSAPSA